MSRNESCLPVTFQKIGEDPRWDGFRPKLAKWFCLCENYPYRMSFLVLVITDREQMAQVNRLRKKHPSLDKYRLVHYQKDRGKTRTGGEGKGEGEGATASASAKAEEPRLELDEDMPIVEAYFRHVERNIYSHPGARNKLSLDGDPVRGRSLVTHPPLYACCAAGFCIALTTCAYLRRKCLPRCLCKRWRIYRQRRK